MMPRALLAGVVLALVAAPSAPAQRPACAPEDGERVVERGAEVVLLHAGRAYRTCSRANGARLELPESIGQAPLLAGPYVLLFAGRGPDVDLILVDVPTQEQTTLMLGSRRAFGGFALDAEGRVATTYRTRAGRTRVLAAGPGRRLGVVSSGRGAVSGLRLDDGRVRWRRAGRARARTLPSATCTRPRGARTLLADATLVVSQRRVVTGDDQSITTTWACLRADGRHRRLRLAEQDVTAGSSLGGFIRAGDLLGYTFRGFARTPDGERSAIVFDPARGIELRSVSGRLVALDAQGRVAALRPAGDVERLVAVGSDGQERTLDEAPLGAIAGVVVAPGTVRWTSAGVVREAPLP